MDLKGSATDLAFRAERRFGVHRKQDLDHARRRGELDVRPRAHNQDAKEATRYDVCVDRYDLARHQIRPLAMISGETIQNQAFFDEVRVPKSNVLGRIDDGWTVAKYLLEFERGGASSPALRVMAEEIVTVAADQPGPDGGTLLDDSGFAHRLTDARIRTEVLEILEYRVLAAVAEGKNPGTATSVLEVLATELSQTLTEPAMEASGPRGRPIDRMRRAPTDRCPNSSRRQTDTSAGSRGRRLRYPRR